MNVTCHMTPMAHGYGGVGCCFTGYNNLKGDLQHLQMLTFRDLFEDKDSVSTKREVKLSKNLFLQFIIEIDVEVLECDCQSFHKN